MAAGPSFVRLRVSSAGIAAVLASVPAIAQQARIEPSLSLRVSWTDNPDLVNQPLEDVWISEVSPSLAMRLDFARLKVSGEVGASAVNYSGGQQRDRVLPRVRLNALLIPVEQVFFINATVSTADLAENPLAPRPGEGSDAATTVNTLSATTYAITPYIDWRLTPRTRLNVRSENTHTETRGSTTTPVQDASSFRHSLRLEVLPLPAGIALEAERSRTDFADQNAATLDTEIVRLIASYRVGSQWLFDVRGGYEDNEASGFSFRRETIYGATIEWTPTERSFVRARGEHRFFGDGWEAVFTHRMPWLSFSLRDARDLSTSQQQLLTLDPTASVAGLLDAILTTRYPDPVERARQVQELIRNQGLPQSLTRSLTLYTTQAIVARNRTVSLALQGRRNAAAITATSSRSESATPAPLIIAGSQFDEFRQRSLGLTYSVRLTSLTAANLTASRAVVQGLQSSNSEETRTKALRLSLNRQLSPTADLAVGAGRQIGHARVAQDYDESSAFIALRKSF